MSLSTHEIAAAADSLYGAGRDRTPIAPIVESYPRATVGDAYEIQRVNLRRYLDAGAVVTGHKIGLTSAPMQSLLGVDEPDFGYILDSMVVADHVAVQQFCAPRVEPEIAFRIGARLKGPGITVEDVRAATDAIAPALEIVDSRIADWRITLPDTVADNASSGAVVLGPWAEAAPHLATLADLRAELIVNGELVDSGTGDAVLGDPAVAVAWLANTLAAYGTAIEAGQFVMSGSITTARFVYAGDHATARFEGLGGVSLFLQ